jgi:4-aminobutyrate aminotransferase-like enzyme
VRIQGKLLGKLLHNRLSTHQFVGSIRGQGLFWGIEFVQDKARRMPFDPAHAVAMGIHELGKSAPAASS